MARNARVLLISLILVFCHSAGMTLCATPGALDPTFSGDGKLIDGRPGHSRDDAYGVAVQSDGKIVVAGNGEFFGSKLARYNPDGTLDATFGTNGSVAGCHAGDVAIQADGKIVVGCSVFNGTNGSFGLVRYDPDGSLDTSFGNDGRAIMLVGSGDAHVNSIALGPDGTIVAVGTVYYSPWPKRGIAVARFKADGSPDTEFDGDGILTMLIGDQGEANSVAVQPDGKIVVAGEAYSGSLGYAFMLLRYNVNGSLDNTFDADGLASTGFGDGSSGAASVAIQSDGKIVAGGHTGSKFALVRYNRNGSLDPTFDTDGRVITAIGSGTGLLPDGANSIAIQPDGRIIAAGYNFVSAGLADTDLAIARYDPNGSLDTTFDGDGKVTTPVNSGVSQINALAIQPDGRIVGVGSTSPWLTAEGGASTENDDFIVVRYNADGKLDSSFDGDGLVTTNFVIFSGSLAGAVVQNDEKIVVVGSGLARYLPDGSPDPTFGTGDGKVGLDFSAKAAAIQIDGKIVVAGFNFDGSGFYTSIARLSRFNVDGSPDTSFGGGGTVSIGLGGEDESYSFTSVAIQPDGRIIAAGTVVARYKPDGSLDTTFGGGTGIVQPLSAAAMAIQPDGKIVLARANAGRADDDFTLARLNADGSLDTSFGGDGYVTTPVSAGNDFANSLALQSDGKIVAVGTSFNGPNADFAAVRYNADGSLDTTFSSDGVVTTPVVPGNDAASSVAIESDGRILTAGYASRYSMDFAFVRYNSDGSLDTTFGDNGISTLDLNVFSSDQVQGMALDHRSRAVVAGTSDGAFAVTRLLLNTGGDRVTVSGRVTSPTGQGLRNAVVSLTDQAGVRRTVVTGAFGFYSFDDVQRAGTYTISVSSRRYGFTPRTLLINESVTDMDLVGSE